MLFHNVTFVVDSTFSAHISYSSPSVWCFSVIFRYFWGRGAAAVGPGFGFDPDLNQL